MCCGSIRIIQTGGGAPFTFSVTGGNSPYNGGLGVITVYGFHQTFPGTIRTKVNPTQNETSLLHLKKIG